MDANAVTCAYRFTLEQYKIARRGDWRRNPTAWMGWVVVVGLFSFALYQTFMSGTTTDPNFYWNLAPLFVFPLIIGYAFIYAPRRVFRKNTAYDAELAYTLGPDGYRLKTPLAKVEIAWAAVPRWIEKPEGFRIYTEGLASFHWLPKSGFASAEAIDRARGFLRDKIAEKKKSFFSWRMVALGFIAVTAVVVFAQTVWDGNAGIRQLNDQAYEMEKQGRYPEALATRKKAWDSCRVNVARVKPLYAWTESRLAHNYVLMGENDAAVPCLEAALKLQQANLPADHPDTIITLNDFSILCYDQGDYARAADLADNAYHLAHQRYGTEHGETLAGMNNLALADERLDRKNEAENLWNEVLRIKQRLHGLQSDELAITLNNLAHLYAGRGNLEKARDFYQQAYELHKKNRGDHPDTAYEEYNLASILNDEEKPDEARPLLKDCLRIREKFLGPDHPDTVDTRHLLESLEPKK